MTKSIMATTVAALLGICANAQETSNTDTNGAPLVSYPTTTASTSPTGTSSPNASTIDMAGRFGAGITFGEPIGATVKYFFTDTVAVDGALGWSLADHSQIMLTSDVLWHDYNLIKVSRGALPVYIGVGPMIRFRDDGFDNQAGIRVPIGASYFLENKPIEFFGEIGPTLDVAPYLRGEITGGIGIRYWF
ncbi:MAG TPA: hypothetical protein VFV81_03135 [Verrucomicrobiae bacterium]|nr:hypothetical protein [Verrucomicrobiae bacterium]